MALTPPERCTWDRLLAVRPQFKAGHPEGYPGISVTLHAHRESCPDCREWLAEVLREDRQLEKEDRRRGG